MIALLPCPFCGHEADYGQTGLTPFFSVHCPNDYCPVSCQATAHTLTEAIKAWNTRHV